MNTIDKNNSTKDLRNQKNDGGFELDKIKFSDNDPREIAERGYAVRNGHNPNKPNPDENIGYDGELDDLDDDFHSEKDLEDTNDDVYIIELENGELESGELTVENDEFDNPSDARENEDFNENEDVLEDIDDEDEDDLDDIDNDDEDEYIEDDVQEDNDQEEYPENDPRRF